MTEGFVDGSAETNKKLCLKSILKEIKEMKILTMVQAHCSTEMVDLFTIVQEQKCL